MPIHLKTSIPGPKSQALMKRREAHVARGPFHATPIFIEKAHGALLEDVDGNTLLDFASGIGVVNVGHTPKTVVERIQKQAMNLLHGSFNVTPYPAYIEICEKLNLKTPGTFLKKSFLANSGAEAIENAVKIARAFTKRQAVVTFDHAFHGRTFMAMAMTAKEKPYKAGFAPFPGPVLRTPFPYTYRWEGTSDPDSVSKECFERLEELCTSVARPDEIAAIFIEPVLGEGGFVVAPPLFLKLLREFCTKNGILLVADEIQTGFGRTGKLFASEHFELVPDLMVTAKGLAAGLPLAAVTGRAEVMDAPEVGGIGGTYGGNPVACEAALGVFEIFEKESLLNQASVLTETFEQSLSKWKDLFPIVGETRGLGPMRAVELVKDKKSKQPHPEAAKLMMKYAYEHGVVILNAGSYSNVLRFLVPLVMDKKDLELGLSIIEAGLKTVS